MIQENRKVVGNLPTIDEVKEKYPLNEEEKSFMKDSREQVRNILTGKDSRKILIIGPCSADFEDSLGKYAVSLRELSDEVRDEMFIIKRFYTGKPRTTTGWTGMIEGGIEGVRKTGIDLIKEHNLPLADEMLNPHLLDYVDDFYTYLAVGARSTENQYHRQVASGLYIPVGMKNPTSGNIETMVNSIIAGQTLTMYTATTQIYQTNGNPYVHGILRGGKGGPNYDEKSILKAFDMMNEKNIKNPSLIIDTSHDNCRVNGKKHPEKQIEIMEYVMELEKSGKIPQGFVKGFMVESYLLGGKQNEDVENPIHGLSLTDPCIGLEKTKKFIHRMHEILSSKVSRVPPPYSY